ncbi:unnamed protein product [Rhizoctonia solani]|uniref:DUF6535 domain-containing protein n=1 Tax=Rhizoctonia solani TaxID=456999 RepID=A0A8H3BNR0_9AGAM|nr:unnamed protein product [Rhizoctonia solani]
MIPPRKLTRAKVEDEDEAESLNGENTALGLGLDSLSELRISRKQSEERGGLEPETTALRGAFDEYGGELARDARIWPTYVREAERWDEDMVDGWNRSLDVILVFAALFSAISSAFLIESAKNLQEDPAETAAASLQEMSILLRAIAQGQVVLNSTLPPDSTGFTPSSVAPKRIGLARSNVGQTVVLFVHVRPDRPAARSSPPKAAQTRRTGTLEDARNISVLAHIDAFVTEYTIFRLTIYLWDIHIGVAIPVLAITALTFIFYAMTTILPLGNAYCPYNTPLSHYIDFVLRKSLSRFRHCGFTQRFLARQYDSDAAADLTGSLSDQVTSRALGWLISHSQDERAVDVALQAIAGADPHMPVQPLIESNVVQRLATRFMVCFNIHPKTGFPFLNRMSSPDIASLYGRALSLVLSCAPDRFAVASELKTVTGTAPDKRPLLMDACFSCLYGQDIFRTNSNVAAFGAASMGMWREFWTRVEWTWPKSPITTSYNLLKKHARGKVTLHTSAIVALVNTIALEAARWLDPRDPEDRGHVAMLLVKLLAQSSLNYSDPVRPAIAVALASFTLAIHDYPGGTSKPSAESRMQRAQAVIQMYQAGPHRDDDYNELLVFGVLGLLKNPGSYGFNSEQVATVAALLRTTFKTDTNSASLPFLPPSFNLDDYLINTALVYLIPSSQGSYFVDEPARKELLEILTLPSHLWAHNEECYLAIADTLLHAKTDELKKACLVAIGSQWMHTPVTRLLRTLFNQGIFQKLIEIMKLNDPGLSPIAMIQLRTMVVQTLGCASDCSDSEKPILDIQFALERIEHSDLFPALASLFADPFGSSLIGPHHVEYWSQPLEALSQEFPREVVESNVLLIMADFYESTAKRSLAGPRLTQVGLGKVTAADRLRATNEGCMIASRESRL